MKKALLNILKVIVRLTLIGLAIFTIVAIVRSYEAEKWSKLLEDTRALVPVVSTEKTEDIVVRVAKEQGISWLLAVRVIECESRWNKYFSERMKDGSKDRGLFAFNDSPKRYGWVTDDEAFNPEIATMIFAQEVKAGNLKNWLCARALGLVK